MLILGIGAFKPNISTQVGALYAPGDTGAIAPIRSSISASISAHFWRRSSAARSPSNTDGTAGFGAAGVGMLVSLGIYLWRPADAAAARHAARLRPHARKEPLDPGERRAVLRDRCVCALVTLFWAAYDQQGNTLLLWAEDFTDRSIDLLFWRGEIPSTWFLALESAHDLHLHAADRAAVGAAGPARHRTVADQQDGVRLPLRRARQSGHGGGGMDRRRQGERAMAGRLFRHRHHRRAPPCAGRAGTGLQSWRPSGCSR